MWHEISEPQRPAVKEATIVLCSYPEPQTGLRHSEMIAFATMLGIMLPSANPSTLPATPYPFVQVCIGLVEWMPAFASSHRSLARCRLSSTYVFCVRYWLYVIWIATRSYSAFMVQFLPFWYETLKDLKGHAVGSVVSEFSVPATIQASHPQPAATIRFRDAVAQEPVFQCKLVFSHVIPPRIASVRPAQRATADVGRFFILSQERKIVCPLMRS